MEGEASCYKGVKPMGACGVINNSHVVRVVAFYMPVKKSLEALHGDHWGEQVFLHIQTQWKK